MLRQHDPFEVWSLRQQLPALRDHHGSGQFSRIRQRPGLQTVPLSPPAFEREQDGPAVGEDDDRADRWKRSWFLGGFERRRGFGQTGCGGGLGRFGSDVRIQRLGSQAHGEFGIGAGINECAFCGLGFGSGFLRGFFAWGIIGLGASGVSRCARGGEFPLPFGPRFLHGVMGGAHGFTFFFSGFHRSRHPGRSAIELPLSGQLLAIRAVDQRLVGMLAGDIADWLAGGDVEHLNHGISSPPGDLGPGGIKTGHKSRGLVSQWHLTQRDYPGRRRLGRKGMDSQYPVRPGGRQQRARLQKDQRAYRRGRLGLKHALFLRDRPHAHAAVVGSRDKEPAVRRKSQRSDGGRVIF